jgi:glutamyl-tRNA synthetase
VSLDSIIRKYALQNAVFFDGEANVKAVVGKVLAEDKSLRSKGQEVTALAQKIVEEVNNLTLEDQTAELEQIDPELMERKKFERDMSLPDLPNVKDKVVMRLAPYPSGPLHIGNARMVLLNDEYVRMHDGKLLLVYDDTIGSEEKLPTAEAYDYIKEGLDWLGVKCHETFYKSDRMDLFYEWGERLLTEGHAYVCECSSEVLRTFRGGEKECAHRGASVEENLENWKKMLEGKYGEGEAIVRIKTDMQHPNPAFRDRVLLRISEREHPRVGSKYRVWPMLELSWAVDDCELGVTHILRGKELVMEDIMEKWIWDALGLEGPEFVHYGMLRLKGVKLSKSQIRRKIETGELTGISDPRTWSMQSLARRGISPEAVRSFVLSLGMSLTDIEVPAENLYAENRKLIDAEAARHFFVPDPVRIEITGVPNIESVEIPLHPEFPERGMRQLSAGDVVFITKDDFENYRGEKVRLKDFCNILLDERSDFISLQVEDIPKIQWLYDHILVEVVMPDGSVVKGQGELTLEYVEEGQLIQFERFGFVKIDSKGDPIVAYFSHK